MIVLAVVGSGVSANPRLAEERAREQAEEREREPIAELRRLQREHDAWFTSALDASHIE